MNIAIFGTGLIGGSMAIALKEKGIATKIIGVELNKERQQQALDLLLADEVMEADEAISKCDIVILAVPVDTTEKMIGNILDEIDKQIVIDVGSTKSTVCKTASQHKNRGRFVATHPMWGTEFSGPQAAVRGAFVDKAVVICDKEASDKDALDFTEKMYRAFGMHIIYMNAAEHDVHAAYVSHISHITSFALANTVLEKEKEEDAIFELASGGFESTVRLAKSNPAMWVPVFAQNRENVLDVLNEHISQLRKFKSCLEKENYAYLAELIENANKISRVLK